jgi:WD40 repeat protein
MSDTANLNATDAAAEPYPSLAALRAMHVELLQRRRLSADPAASLAAEFPDEAALFIRRARETGTLLDVDDDRWACQSLMEFWANMLYRAGSEPPDTTLAEFDPNLAPELPDDLCPYLGLDAFRETSHERFFGRQRLIADMVAQLESNRLLAVVGPSGSGKSSLVQGGLVPTLKQGALPGSQDWHYCTPIVPGSEPLTNLARLFQTNATTPGDQNTATLRASISAQERPLVIVIDQFEELFTLCDDEQARQQFVEMLVYLATATEQRHTVILTMRSDFESHVVRFSALQQLFQQAEVRVTPLNAAELREVIEKPAELIGLKFEEGVVDALLQDILGEPAALPLLQFTLLTLWERRERNRVTWEMYRQLGGGRLALERSADAFYEGLIPEEQVTVKRILLRMVRSSEGLEVTSSRVRRDVLYRAGEAHDRVDRVLDKLIRAHLVRQTEGETPGDAQVEVAHEALIRNWRRLVGWLDEDRAVMTTRRRLEARTAEWVRLGGDRAGLLDEVQVLEAERWLASPDASDLGYNPDVLRYVQASRTVIDETKREEQQARQRELTQAQALAQAEHERATAQSAASRRLRQLALALMLLLGLAIGAVIYAARQSIIVLQQLQVADSQRLAFAAQGLVREAPETALLLAYEAADRNHNAVSEQALRDVLDQLAWRPTVLSNASPARREPFSAATLSLDGQLIVTASVSGTLQIWGRTGQPKQTFNAHAGTITSVVLSDDGQQILTASTDMTAGLWSIQGQQLATFHGHTAAVISAVFSPDGQQVLTASQDTTARLWDRSGKLIATFSGHEDALANAVFSPDGQQVLAASADGSARLWDRSGKLISTLGGHEGGINHAVFSHDGQALLTASNDGTARLWDSHGQPLATFSGHTDRVTSATFSSDGQQILTASADRTARLWDRTGKPLATLSGHTDVVTNGIFSPDEKNVLTASDDGTARLWDRSGTLITTLSGHHDHIASVRFSADGTSILTASADGTARLWEPAIIPLATFNSPDSALTSAVFSPDGQQVLTILADGTVRLWDENGQQRLSFNTDSDIITSAVFSPDGRQILTASADGAVQVWDTTGKLVTLFPGHNDIITSAVFSPDGQSILTASADTTAKLWDRQGHVLATMAELPDQADTVNSAVFSPDGQQILTASSNHIARLWDRSGKKLAAFEGHTNRITSAVFSTDGQRVLTASADRTARLWDLRGQLLATLSGHTDAVNSAMFSPDGTRIATASRDGKVQLWDHDGLSPVTLNGGTTDVVAIASVRFSADGQRLLTAAADGVARQYLVNVDDLLPIAGCWAGQPLAKEAITRFSIPQPMRFDIIERQCAPLVPQ